MKDKDEKKEGLIEELKTLREERGESAINDITEHANVKEKFPSFTKDILDSSAVGIFILDSDFRVVWINKAIESYFGLQREKIIGKDKRKLIKKNIQHIFEDPDEFTQKVFATYENNTYVENFECHVLHEGKRKERWLDHWSQPIKSGLYAGGRTEHYYDITGRKQSEKKLRDSEEWLKILFNYAPDAYYIHDLKGNFIDGNQVAERIIGCKKEELIGKSFIELKLLSTKDIPKATKSYAKTIMGLPTGPDEYVLNRKDKSTVAVEISNYPVKIKGKTYVLGIARDITARKQAEKVLKESEERYHTVFENTGTATIIIEEDKIISMVNTQSEKMYGYSKKEIENKMKWTDFVLPEDLERMKKYHIERRKAGGKAPTEYEFRLIDKKGNIRDIFLKIGMIPNTKKSIASLIDITERKQAEEKIKHLNLVLRAIRSVNQLIVKENNRERLLKGVCNNLIKTRGYYSIWMALLDEEGKLKTYAEAGLGKAFLPMIELLKKGRLTACGKKALKQQKVVTTEDPAFTCPECPLSQEYSGRGAMTIRLEHNEKVYGLMSVSIPAHLAVDQEEQTLFKEVAGDLAFSIHNIELGEERKQAEENVKKAKDELQMILDSVPAIIFYKDTEGRIIRANKTLANSLKISVKDIVGKTTEELFSREQAEKMRKDDREVIISGKAKRNIIQPYTTPEGPTRWAITDKVPHKDKEGKITGVISLSKDITVQRKSKEELQQTYQKLKKTMDATINTMSRIIEAKDPYTSGHQHRVCQLAVPLARELGLTEDKIEGIRIASLIHDIGKIGIPTEILSKPSKLSDIEFSLIKDHSQIGYDIIKSIDFSYPVAQIVLQHHERINGSGYPNHLKGDEILLEAKIIGVADVVEAMSSFRPYRPALGINKALEEISQNKGILYDPEVVDACLKLFKERGFKFE